MNLKPLLRAAAVLMALSFLVGATLAACTRQAPQLKASKAVEAGPPMDFDEEDPPQQAPQQ